MLENRWQWKSECASLHGTRHLVCPMQRWSNYLETISLFDLGFPRPEPPSLFVTRHIKGSFLIINIAWIESNVPGQAFIPI
jgi:hypothetical protein